MCRCLAVIALCLPVLVWAGDDAKLAEGKVLFESYCGACHSIMLPKSQRLDRNNWAWVIDDMVNDMGCAIKEDEAALVVDYLVENFGPNSK